MDIRSETKGFSLVEVIVTAFILTLVILLIAKIFHFNAVIMHKSDLLTTAASLAEDISSKIKDQPFDAVISFDSGNPHPAKIVYGNPAFKPEAYYIDIDETPMKQVLNDALARVRSQNFDNFKLDVVYVRRDSSASSSVATDGYVNWTNNHPSGPVGPRSTLASDNYVCDVFDPNVCFHDLNDDGDYWDVVSGIPETPFTGLKMLTISIMKKGEPIGVKRGTILSLGGFSGKEITSAQSPLKLRIKRPNSSSRAFQVTPATKASLELPTRRTYPSYWFDVTNPNHISQRIDNTITEAVQINKTIDVSGAPLSPGYSIPGTDANLRIFGETDSGQSGTLEVTAIFNSAAFPTSISDAAAFTPTGYDFSIIGNLPATSVLLLTDGLHRLWSRKRTNPLAAPPVYSPYDVRTILVDNGIPQKMYFMDHESGGDRPRVGITISDFFQVDGITPSYYSGLAYQPTSVIVKNLTTGVSSHTWGGSYTDPGRGIWKNWDVGVVYNDGGPYRTFGATTTLRLRDADGYPWKLTPGNNYQVTWEWGDRAGYKNSAVELFTPINGAFTAPGGFQLTLSRPGYQLLGYVPAGYYPVKRGLPYSIHGFNFRDADNGFDYPAFKVEVCRDMALPAMNISGPTSADCRTVFSKIEGIRPKPSVAWGDWISYGGPWDSRYDSFLLWFVFTDPGVGPFTGFDFTNGSKWVIRVYTPNSSGAICGWNSWGFEIVP